MGTILRRSVLRAALPSLLTLGALSLGSLMGGAVVVESLFRWDGVGRMAAEAVFMRDYPVIEAYVLWTAFSTARRIWRRTACAGWLIRGCAGKEAAHEGGMAQRRP